MKQHKSEVAQGQRFEFGVNWRGFLSSLNDDRIRFAENSLQAMLEVEDLRGKTFLDAGSGSGLFSLAARRLGARTRSFDYDPQAVACTAELKRRYFPGRSRMDHRGRLSAGHGLVGSAGQFRYRLFLGGLTPHRGHAASSGKCDAPGCGRGEALHSHLQRPREKEREMAAHEAGL